LQKQSQKEMRQGKSHNERTGHQSRIDPKSFFDAKWLITRFVVRP
jgi:hypothetical protein